MDPFCYPQISQISADFVKRIQSSVRICVNLRQSAEDLFLDRQFRGFPGVETSGEIADVGETFLLKQTRGETGAVTGGAINEDGALLVEFAETFR